jgi:hypothetical protein
MLTPPLYSSQSGGRLSDALSGGQLIGRVSHLEWAYNLNKDSWPLEREENKAKDVFGRRSNLMNADKIYWVKYW